MTTLSQPTSALLAEPDWLRVNATVQLPNSSCNYGEVWSQSWPGTIWTGLSCNTIPVADKHLLRASGEHANWAKQPKIWLPVSRIRRRKKGNWLFTGNSWPKRTPQLFRKKGGALSKSVSPWSRKEQVHKQCSKRSAQAINLEYQCQGFVFVATCKYCLIKRGLMTGIPCDRRKWWCIDHSGAVRQFPV